MQVSQPLSSTQQANTALRTRPPMASKRLDLSSRCEICDRYRTQGSHTRCSKIRKQRKDAEWAAYMANQAAKKALKQDATRGVK